MLLRKSVKPEPKPISYVEDGYDSGGLVYFHFDNRAMVAVIRERSEFDKHLNGGTTLQDYVETPPGKAFPAGLGIAELIPEVDSIDLSV